MSLLTFPWSQLLDSNGDTYPGAKLSFYETGTSTLAAVYSDGALTTPHTNPVVADAQGVFPPIYLAAKQYKVVLRDALNATLFSADPVIGSGYIGVATIDDMKAIPGPTNGASVLVLEEGRGGVFVFDTALTSAADNGTTFKANGATTGSWARRYDGAVSVKWFDAKGDGATNDTAAIAAAIASSPKSLMFPPGVYRTTGNVIPANSGIGAVIGVGRPVLQRFGQATTGNQPNLNILVVYKNRVAIKGIEFDGINNELTIGGGFPAATEYVDLALNSTVGSADATASTDNLTLVTDCYFRDCPGSCIAGSGMQSVIVNANKFDGWFDHAVYLSGGDALGLGMDAIVSSNIFRHLGTGYGPNNNAVKVRNRARRYVVTGNTLELNGTRFFTHDGGDPPNTNYVPTEVIVSNNVGESGIFFSMLYNLPASNDAQPLVTIVSNNNIACSERPFYLGEDASAVFVGSLIVDGNSFTNTSGSWKALFDCRFVHATVPARIEARNNIIHGFAVMQGVYPNTLTVEGNTFREVAAAFLFSDAAESGPEGKIARILNNSFIRDAYDGQGAFDLNVSGDARVEIRGNYYQNCAAVARIRKLPELLVMSDNVLKNAVGVQYTAAQTARLTLGEIIVARNKAYGQVLFEETIATGDPLLVSYNIFLADNFTDNIANGIRATGASVTGYAGSNKVYARDNHGIAGAYNVAYDAANKQNTLPAITI